MAAELSPCCDFIIKWIEVFLIKAKKNLSSIQYRRTDTFAL